MPPFIYVLQSELRARASRRILSAAASRHGISLAEYVANLERGLLWCSFCKGWHPSSEFGLKRSGRAGRDSCCLSSRRAYGRDNYIPVPDGERQPPLRIAPEVRFWKYVKKMPSGCWEWQGGRLKGGYGQLRLPDGHVLAHVFSWRLHKGPVPKGLLVCHKCDNPPCVNPEDLFLGTHQDNADDRTAKGRSVYVGSPGLHGEANPSAKLTAEQVAEIRRIYVPYLFPCRKLAEEFHVSKHQIENIVNGVSWREL